MTVSDCLLSEVADVSEYTDLSPQDKELGSKKPISTLFSLAFGPFISSLVSSAYGFVETYYFTKAFGDSSLAVLGAVFPMVIVTSLFPPYLTAGYGVQTGYLFGQNRAKDVAQLYVDHLRIAIIVSILFAIIVFFFTEPLCIMLGASPELAKKGKEYLGPYGYGSVFSLVMSITCTLYLTTGRSTIYGAAQLGSAILNQGLIAPILLFVIKTPIWGSQLSTTLTSAIFAIWLTVPVFYKETEYRPSFSMFLKPFMPETKKAFIIGIPSLFDVLARSCTPMLVQSFLVSAARRKGNYNEVFMIWGVNNKIQFAVMLFTCTFTGSYIPSASYADGAKKNMRLLRLTFHAIWLSCGFTSILAILFIVFVRKVASIWSSDAKFLDTAAEILPIFHYTIPLQGFQTIAQTMVMVLQLPVRASVMSVFSYGIPIMVFSTMMYKIKNNDPAFIAYAYNITDIWSSIFSILCMLQPLSERLKGEKLSKMFTNEI